MAANAILQPMGDSAWFKVDTRRPAHELEAGVAADALNKRFEEGEAWPRYGVGRQMWGMFTTDAIGSGKTWTDQSSSYRYYEITGLTIGRRYWLVNGNATDLTDSYLLTGGFPSVRIPDGNHYSGWFTATQTTLYLWAHFTDPTDVTAHLYYLNTKTPRGLGRFNDPNSKSDNLILVTDDWRTAGGEDGGRGKAWRIVPGQGIQSITLNGHDVWGESRIISADTGCVLVRQGNERHYFKAAAINTGTSRITLNATPAWANGDEVFFVCVQDATFPLGSAALGSSPPADQTIYYVKNIAGSPWKVELYTDSALTTPLVIDGASYGAFYLERRALKPGNFGNGAPPLLMQPDGSGATAFEVGFKSVPAAVLATAFNGTTKVLTAANHRLLTGDKIKYIHNDTTVETFYVYVMSGDNLRLFATVDKSLANLDADAQILTPVFASGDHIVKDGASGLPMPPGREGVYLACNRLVLVNQDNRLAVSDALDPLHFTPFLANVTANLGESDIVSSLTPITDDSLIVGKGTKVLLLVGLSQTSNNWKLTDVTSEYGFEAPLAACQVGADVWGAGRKGVVSVFQTTQGKIQGVAEPKSREMKRYLDQVDWQHISGASAKTWNNRYFLAVPLKGQDAASGVRNNAVLVYNTLNGGWEGMWQGDGLQVYDWARVKIFGEERLCFVDYEGSICFLSDDFEDYGPVAIVDRLTTRIYHQNQQRMLFLKGKVIWNTYGPKLTVTAVAPGVNERQAALMEQEYDRTKYLVKGKSDFDPTAEDGDWESPDRQDYALAPDDAMNGEADVHQNVEEGLRFRVRDWGVQLEIANGQGSARISGVRVEAVPVGSVASRQT